MRVRDLLAKERFEPKTFKGAPLVCQTSSLGLLCPRWLRELRQSFCGERRGTCALMHMHLASDPCMLAPFASPLSISILQVTC
jgi:hypothetical protein